MSKGSGRRGTSREELARYAENYDRIFRKKKPGRAKLKPYPSWVCAECGRAASGRGARFATWHPDKCGVCGESRACTEPRDYGYPDFPGFETRKQANARWMRTLSDAGRMEAEVISLMVGNALKRDQ